MYFGFASLEIIEPNTYALFKQGHTYAMGITSNHLLIYSIKIKKSMILNIFPKLDGMLG